MHAFMRAGVPTNVLTCSSRWAEIAQLWRKTLVTPNDSNKFVSVWLCPANTWVTPFQVL